MGTSLTSKKRLNPNTKPQAPSPSLALLGAALIFITAAAFFPSLKNGFTRWDDGLYLTDNPLIRHLSWQSIQDMFMTFQQGFYNPLVLVSFAIEYHFFKLEPFVYHATNLSFHLLNTLLVFWLFLKLDKNKLWLAFVTALLFGIHPMHVESVAWVSERKDVLSTFFFLLSLITYYTYRQANKIKHFYGSLGCLTLSLLCKPMAATLPVVLILMDYLMGRRSDRKSLLEKIPYFVISVGFILLAVYSHFSFVRSTQLYTLFLWQRFCVACHGVQFYILKLLLPLELSTYYPYPEGIMQTLPLSFLISPLFVAVLLSLTFFISKTSRKVPFGVLFFLITVAPVLQFFPSGRSSAEDHFIYIPSIGLFYLIGTGTDRLATFKPKLKPALLIMLALITAGLSYLTWQRCTVWKDNSTLFQDVLKKYPRVAVGYFHRAVESQLKGDSQSALADFNKALELDPGFTEAYINRAALFRNAGRFQEALADHNMALRLKPNYAEGYNTRGITYRLMGEIEKAIEDYNETLRIDPHYFGAYVNRGSIYRYRGEYEKALSDYNQAIRLMPDLAEAYNNRGYLYIIEGDYPKALSDFDRAISLNAQYAKAYFNKAELYKKLSRKEEAVETYKKLISQNAGDPSEIEEAKKRLEALAAP